MTRGRDKQTPDKPYAPGVPIPPDGMNHHAQFFWDLVCDNLPAGTLCEIDTILLHQGATAYGLWCHVISDKELDLYKKVSLARMLTKDIQEVCKQFGMSPAQRKRLNLVTQAADVDDPIKEYVS